jgi:NADH-quinone oxidoreductase subunit H
MTTILLNLIHQAELIAGKAGIPSSIIHLVVMALAMTIVMTLCLLTTVFLIYVERKTWAYMQVRIGPIRVGPKGVLQPVADGLKLFLKEDIIPDAADKLLFRLAPIIVVVPALMAYLVIPFGKGMIVQDLSVGVLYILAVTSVSVLGIIGSGWASNNKYSLLGGMRSAAQIVSYEVPVVLSLLAAVLYSGTLSMNDIVDGQAGGFWHWNAAACPFLLIASVVYLIGSLAELNRTPFDLPEAESELVAGFNTEYSGMRFAFFFLAEWMNIFLLACIAVTMFFGGWHAPFTFLELPGRLGSFVWFFAKVWFLMFIVIWIRATYPRFRVDQLMEFAWKTLIPISLVNILVIAGWLLLRPHK